MTTQHPIVGIIGGMGPEATVELMRRVIAATPATDDHEHIHLIVDNNPTIPSRIAHLIDGTGIDPTPELQRMARGLQSAGAGALAMPCNTAHAYADEIRAAVNIPLLDMIELTSQHIARLRPCASVGLLASSAVIRSRLYAAALAKFDCRLRLPAQQTEIMALIRGVKAGQAGSEAHGRFATIATELSSDCDVLLVACTELSILAAALPAAMTVVDSMDVLCQAIVEYAKPPR